MATDKSLALAFFTVIILVGSIVYAASMLIEMNKLIAVGVALVMWPLAFPVIIKTRKYEQRQYWLPKSRALGYLIYLVVPVSIVVLTLTAAIYFEVGM
jgi:hypothetical protein